MSTIIAPIPFAVPAPSTDNQKSYNLYQLRQDNLDQLKQAIKSANPRLKPPEYEKRAMHVLKGAFRRAGNELIEDGRVATKFLGAVALFGAAASALTWSGALGQTVNDFIFHSSHYVMPTLLGAGPAAMSLVSTLFAIGNQTDIRNFKEVRDGQYTKKGGGPLKNAKSSEETFKDAESSVADFIATASKRVPRQLGKPTNG